MTHARIEPLIPLEDQVALVLHNQGRDSFICTVHKVDTDEDGRSTIREGQILNRSALLGILAALCGKRDTGASLLLPYGTLTYRQGELMIWHVPGKVRPMWFHLDDGKLRLDVPWPDLVLAAVPGDLCLAALPSGTRPAPDSPLFHAPLMNVWASTRLCLGNSGTPRDITPDSQHAWEALVFDTCFSHTNHSRTLRIGRGVVSNETHIAFWQELHDRKARRFPGNRLVSLGANLSEWAEMLANP